jgi:tetratricopeptide (TPR) repeat protein
MLLPLLRHSTPIRSGGWRRGKIAVGRGFSGCIGQEPGLDVYMRFQKPLGGLRWAVWLGIACVFVGITRTPGADLAECRKLYLKGNYAGCIRAAEQAIKDITWNDEWPLMLAKAQLAIGKYPEAQTTVTNALHRYSSSVPLRLLAYDLFRASGQTENAAAILEELGELGRTRGNYTRDLSSLIAMGKVALLLNADPKLVLDNFFEQAKRTDPKFREAYLASGELALDKHDYDLAAKEFNEALKVFPDDPEVEFGLARAYVPSDAEEATKALQAVLDYNPNHVPSMLLLVDHMIDAEQYAEADKMLTRARAVNPWDPEAWSYQAVLAHLRSDSNAVTAARQAALKYWRSSPRVDYLIGKKLAQNYRFVEGAIYQRQALKFDPQYLPAKIQLAEDLLRLGNETEGWQLAEEVHRNDGYDVMAYNLVTLRGSLAKFQTLTNQDFIVRMSPREAALYGDRVLDLLQRAKARLTEKYGVQIEQPTTIEIFPEQKDFGVRTFGMPLNPGFLGVCFGHVITANSPASQAGHPANWEAVLWHEFCHVVTLQLTKNKMPRWLSEGISVYEECQANPIWGQAMNPHYRELILGDGLTPVGKLSAAFMSSKKDANIQFAYFESELVVEYLVQNYGLDSLKQILADLGAGVEINAAIAKHTAPLDKIEKEFVAFARRRAEQLAPGLDWNKPKKEARGKALADLDSVIPIIVKSNSMDVVRQLEIGPKETTNAPPPGPGKTQRPSAVEAKANSANYWELLRQAKTALGDERWAEAKPPLQKLLELYPTATGSDSAYALLAAACRGLNETNQERQLLAKLATLQADAGDVYLRLMELEQGTKDWPGVATNAERFLAVNPLLPQPYRYLGRAGEELGRPATAIRSYQRLLLLDPPDPAEVHFRLARLLYQQGELPGAKRHVLQALEEAPRYRDAQRLLLEIEKDPRLSTTSLAPSHSVVQVDP